MPQYLLSVHSAEAVYDEPLDDKQGAFEAVDAFNQKIVADGVWVFGGGLERPSTATVVDNTAGQNLITDGPYLEVKEWIGGFWVIDVPDLDAALALAAEASQACENPVEVRPFQAEPEPES